MDQFLSIFKIFFPILFGIMSTYFLVIALRGIITRRPFLVSNRWMLCLMFVVFYTNYTIVHISSWHYIIFD